MKKAASNQWHTTPDAHWRPLFHKAAKNTVYTLIGVYILDLIHMQPPMPKLNVVTVPVYRTSFQQFIRLTLMS